MKVMKSIVCVVLVLLICFSFTACSKTAKINRAAISDGTLYVEYELSGKVGDAKLKLTFTGQDTFEGTVYQVFPIAGDAKSIQLFTRDVNNLELTVDGSIKFQNGATVASDTLTVTNTDVRTLLGDDVKASVTILDGDKELGSASVIFDTLSDAKKDEKKNGNKDAKATEAAEETFKAGFIFVGDENAVYDKNFIEGAKAACEKLGVDYIFKTNVSESDECKEAADDLVAQGCGYVFGDSYGHEDYLIQAAKEHPDVEFAQASGIKAHTEGLRNYHNTYAKSFEGRYLSGAVAGMKLQEMIDNKSIKEDEAKLGYVAPFTYAEVVSDYTAFFLGARSVCPKVTMEVQFTGSWSDPELEQKAYTKLFENKCQLVALHNEDLSDTRNIVASKIDWQPYFEYAIKAAMNKEKMEPDWIGSLSTGSINVSIINPESAAKGTEDKLREIEASLKDGSLHVFDISAFTVDGKKVEKYVADVDSDDQYTPDTEVIANGYFHECEYRSAPYFDLKIDGIKLLNEDFG